MNINKLLYLPQNKQVKLFVGYSLPLKFLETPFLSKVQQLTAHESKWGSRRKFRPNKAVKTGQNSSNPNEDLCMNGLKNTIETYGLLEPNPLPFQNTVMRWATIRSGIRLSLLTETHIGAPIGLKRLFT